MPLPFRIEKKKKKLLPEFTYEGWNFDSVKHLVTRGMTIWITFAILYLKFTD